MLLVLARDEVYLSFRNSLMVPTDGLGHALAVSRWGVLYSLFLGAGGGGGGLFRSTLCPMTAAVSNFLCPSHRHAAPSSSRYARYVSLLTVEGMTVPFLVMPHHAPLPRLLYRGRPLACVMLLLLLLLLLCCCYVLLNLCSTAVMFC